MTSVSRSLVNIDLILHSKLYFISFLCVFCNDRLKNKKENIQRQYFSVLFPFSTHFALHPRENLFRKLTWLRQNWRISLKSRQAHFFPSLNVHSVKKYASPLRIGTDRSVSTAFASKSNNVNEFYGLVQWNLHEGKY